MKLVLAWIGVALCVAVLSALVRHDWKRLTGSRRLVEGEVVGHRQVDDGESRCYAAIYAFSAEGERHEVVDPIASARRTPVVGAVRQLAYPAGHPALARPPAPVVWTGVYLFLIVTIAILLSQVIMAA